jgi:FAD/FMN-containing dehydrogenase/Fe-S oxidoreductase
MDEFFSQKRQLLLEHLRKEVDGEVRFDPPSCKLYSTDASLYQIMPLGVVIPRSEQGLLTAVQIALETRTPIVPRGGGTSLSGQAIGPGLVIDCSKYLNALIDLDTKAQKVRVQPGIVLDQLNRLLAPHGLLFGPDVSTASRATLGGMIGNNSAGSRSIVYGKTGDHVVSLKTILSDGSAQEFRQLSEEAWNREPGRENLRSQAHQTLREILTRDGSEIDRRFPKIIRRVSGYNLGSYIEKPLASRSLLPLLVGSEGTLAMLAEAELNLVPKPRHRGLLVPQFETLASALDALSICLEFAPSAVELMDAMLIQLARNQRALNETMSIIQGQPEALLMVEFQGDDLLQIQDRIERLKRHLHGCPGVIALVPALDSSVREPLWNLRRAAVPLLFGMPGDRKPVTFVEDTAVAPEHLPEFTKLFREILRKHGTDGAFYGHASVGCLHIRPVLNLKDPDDLKRMRTIMDDVTDLVLRFNGSLSGEHGDGLVRSEWNRKMYGPTVYEAFRQIKRTLDPHGLFNPGKIVDAPSMTDNLRTSLPPRIELPTVFDYTPQQGFFRSIELCNGSGVCRKLQGGVMCPSYRATLDEKDSTRGRANALRIALTEPPEPLRENPLHERWLFEVMDLCLSCKACKTECPSNVDLAKLKAEFQQAYYEKNLRPLGHYLAANIHRLNRRSAPFAPFVNWLNRRSPVRWLMEKITGIDRRRSLPMVHRQHFRKWFARRKPRVGERKVLLFDDCFTTYNEPQIGGAAVEVLEAANVSVELVQPICCGRALLSKGFVKEAKSLVEQQLPGLFQRVKNGLPILGLEPSCILTLADEWPELVPSPEAKRVAESVQLAEVWLAQETKLNWKPLQQKCQFHAHCHQRALCGTKGTASALKQIPELDVEVLDAGCCGMAGAFGYEREHFDLSLRIAQLGIVPQLESSPDSLVVATGTSCRHQIKDTTGRVALHPVELLNQNLAKR